MSTNLNAPEEVYDLEAARRAREERATESTPSSAAIETAEDTAESIDEPEATTEDEGAPVLVEGEVLAVRDDRGTVAQRAAAPRREVVPGWMRDREAAKAAAKWVVSYYGHRTMYHGVRTPLYYAKLAGRSPVGLGRILAAVYGWVFDTAQAEVRHQVYGKTTDAHAYLRLKEAHSNRVKRRLAGVVFALLVVAGLVAYIALGIDSVLIHVGLAAGALAGLGLLGRNADKPITGRAVDTVKEPRLTSDLILKALGSLGIGQINAALTKRGADALSFATPVMRDGAGWRVDIDLPDGVTASEVLERREKLAAGLRRPISRVWPEGDPSVHAGRLVLYVADKAFAETKATPWPLSKTGKVNVFEPFPIGVDQRGREITVTLMFASGIIGALPRMGKTFLLRLLELAACLDPRTEAYIFDFKGTGDHRALAHVAHAYVATAGEAEDLAAVMASLRALAKEATRRARVVKNLPEEICPENKVTDQLSSDKSLGLHPILLCLDETQVLFENKDYGKEAAEICEDLVRRGPAVGIMVWLATQRPDATSIPSAISSNAALRACLKVNGQPVNDMILGTSMYKNGIRATQFSLDDKGIAYLVGEGNEPVIFRSAFIDAVEAKAIAVRARAARLAAGRLTGIAAGEDLPTDETGNILDHLLAVWPANDPDWPTGKVWCEELAARLSATQPSLYEGWTGEQITAAVKPHGIRPVQIKRTDPDEGKPVNKRGLVRRDLTDTLGHTDPNQNTHPAPTSGSPAGPTAGPFGGPLKP